MPSSDVPHDPHDPRFELELQDALVLLALGEPVEPWVEAHRVGCRRCQEDLAGLSQTVRVARETVPARAELDATPSPSVWAGIAAELGLDRPSATVSVLPGAAGPTPVGVVRHRRAPVWRRALLVAAAVVAVLGAAVGGFTVGHRSSTTSPAVSGTAHLAEQPGGPRDVAGTATVRATTRGDELAVNTRGLPLRDGYYEVWLYDPKANQMIAVGTLGQDGAGTFPVPPGLDVRAYHVVDVSAQNYDGDPRHQQSVLRGGLTS